MKLFRLQTAFFSNEFTRNLHVLGLKKIPGKTVSGTKTLSSSHLSSSVTVDFPLGFPLKPGANTVCWTWETAYPWLGGKDSLEIINIVIPTHSNVNFLLNASKPHLFFSDLHRLWSCILKFPIDILNSFYHLSADELCSRGAKLPNFLLLSFLFSLAWEQRWTISWKLWLLPHTKGNLCSCAAVLRTGWRWRGQRFSTARLFPPPSPSPSDPSQSASLSEGKVCPVEDNTVLVLSGGGDAEWVRETQPLHLWLLRVAVWTARVPSWSSADDKIQPGWHDWLTADLHSALLKVVAHGCLLTS